ncbi:MAG: TetR/AcrR family transcriptional regulator [Bacteroidetes bacterium]|nr:MAG: TetR/AcrR family transcriptional regulator [Bacteroidota bacterium]
MGKVSYTGDSKERIDEILDAAQKRMGLYGFKKTTMQEIANDLQMSKASLYYYFPDKESLFLEVIRKEQQEYFLVVQHRMDEISDPKEAIRELVRLRQTYFMTFINLNKLRFTDFRQIKPHFEGMIQELRKKDHQLVTSLLEKGIQQGVFRIGDPQSLATLFLEILHGLRLVIIQRKPFIELREEDFEQMMIKTIDFTRLFIRSIETISSTSH